MSYLKGEGYFLHLEKGSLITRSMLERGKSKKGSWAMFCLLLNFFFTRGNLIETKIPLKFTPLRSTFLLSTFWEKDTSIHQEENPTSSNTHTLWRHWKQFRIFVQKTWLTCSCLAWKVSVWTIICRPLVCIIGLDVILLFAMVHTHTLSATLGMVVWFSLCLDERSQEPLLVYICANHPT